MSILSVAYLKEGIVLSSDCRGTFTKEVNGENVSKILDRAPKTFLIEDINVGVSYCGNMRLEGELFHFAIDNFVKENVNNSDNVYTVAKKLFEKYKGNGTTFLVCGYLDGEQYVFVIDEKMTCLNKKKEGLYCGVKPFGMTAFVEEHVSPNYRDKNWSEVSLLEGIEIAEEMVKCAIENEESCGGPVSTLIIDSVTAKWYRKHGITQTIKTK